MPIRPKLILLASVILVGVVITYVPVSKGSHISGIYLGGEKQFEIRSNYSGIVHKLHVKDGDFVAANKELVTLIDPAARALIMRFRETLKPIDRNIAVTAEKISKKIVLFNAGYISKQEVLADEEHLNNLKAERSKIETQIEELISKEKSYATITSTRIGQIDQLSIHIGQQVFSGDKILNIIPLESSPLVEIYISPRDLGFIHKSQKIEVRFVSLPRNAAPLLSGELIAVSTAPLASGNMKNISNQQQKAIDGMYRGLVRINETEMAKMSSFAIVQGMPVEAIAEVGQQTILQYLILPFRQLIERAFTEG